MDTNDCIIHTINWMIPSIRVKNLNIQETLIGILSTKAGFSLFMNKDITRIVAKAYLRIKHEIGTFSQQCSAHFVTWLHIDVDALVSNMVDTTSNYVGT